VSYFGEGEMYLHKLGTDDSSKSSKLQRTTNAKTRRTTHERERERERERGSERKLNKTSRKTNKILVFG